MTKLTRTTVRRSSLFAAQRIPFDAGNMTGQQQVPGGGYTTGRLPERFRSDVNRADFVVRSYATPIAWHIPGEGWVIPPVTYSATTAQHQSKCREAARGQLADHNLARPIDLGLTPTQAKVLEIIREGGRVDQIDNGSRSSTLQAVVDTGEARWVGPQGRPPSMIEPRP